MSGLARLDLTISVAKLKGWRRWFADEHCIAAKIQFPVLSRVFLLVPGRVVAYTEEDPAFDWTDYTIPANPYALPLAESRMHVVLRQRIGTRYPALDTVRDALAAAGQPLGMPETGHVTLKQFQSAMALWPGLKINHLPQPYAMGVWHE